MMTTRFSSSRRRIVQRIANCAAIAAKPARKPRKIVGAGEPVEDDAHEETFGLGIVELLRIEDIAAMFEEIGRNRRHDARTVGTGERQNIVRRTLRRAPRLEWSRIINIAARAPCRPKREKETAPRPPFSKSASASIHIAARPGDQKKQLQPYCRSHASASRIQGGREGGAQAQSAPAMRRGAYFPRGAHSAPQRSLRGAPT